MVITPTMLTGLAYGGPVIVSTICSWFAGRAAARGRVEQFKQELTGSTTAAIKTALNSPTAVTGPLEERIEHSRVTAQAALDRASEAKALTREALERARAAEGMAEESAMRAREASCKVEQASDALSQLLAQAQVAAGQIDELLQVAREQARGKDTEAGSEKSSQTRRPHRRQQRQQPVLNGASGVPADPTTPA
jgi:hypothetical protein